jgi:hypothetical protein
LKSKTSLTESTRNDVVKPDQKVLKLDLTTQKQTSIKTILKEQQSRRNPHHDWTAGLDEYSVTNQLRCDESTDPKDAQEILFGKNVQLGTFGVYQRLERSLKFVNQQHNKRHDHPKT